jgi:hypothetical protein
MSLLIYEGILNRNLGLIPEILPTFLRQALQETSEGDEMADTEVSLTMGCTLRLYNNILI